MAFSVLKTAAALLIILLCLFKASEPKNMTGERLPPVPKRQLRAPVPPSERNPCTNIPGQGHGRCTLAEDEDGDGNNNENGGSSAFPGMNFDGSVAASVANQTQKENASLSS